MVAESLSLHALAARCVASATVADKIALTSDAAARFADGDAVPEASAFAAAALTTTPGRPSRPRLVQPRGLPQRGLASREGRAALVHAVAHIEFNAINLAWDAVARFRGLPFDYYRDWDGVAVDEARHFGWLAARLADLGHAYGDFDAHDGLWDMAVRTAESCLARMALVPRVLEARGLDVTPGMIVRLRKAGDEETARVLEAILAEEVAHQLLHVQGEKTGEPAHPHAISIRGTEGIAVELAQCCHPIPGDPILGFIHKERGLIIHTHDCPSIRAFRTDPDKWLDVEWEAEPGHMFDVSIKVVVGNQRGVLAKIAAAIAEHGSNIGNVAMEEEDGSPYTVLFFTVQVENRMHLARVMRGLRVLPDVVRIFRIKGKKDGRAAQSQ